MKTLLILILLIAASFAAVDTTTHITKVYKFDNKYFATGWAYWDLMGMKHYIGLICTSTDSLTWTRACTAGEGHFYLIDKLGDRFVAVGYITATQPLVVFSMNGSAWNKSYTPTDTNCTGHYAALTEARIIKTPQGNRYLTKGWADYSFGCPAYLPSTQLHYYQSLDSCYTFELYDGNDWSQGTTLVQSPSQKKIVEGPIFKGRFDVRGRLVTISRATAIYLQADPKVRKTLLLK